MRTFLISIIFIIICYHLSAQQNVKHDSSNVHVREFSSQDLSAYKSNREFQYDKIHEPPKSLWNRVMAWIYNRFRGLVGELMGGGVTSWLLTIIAAAIIVFFLMKFSGMADGGVFGKKSGKKLEYTVNYEDIHSINFDAVIQEAINNKNFRMAVRLMYLQILKNLADKGTINWQINKTNLDYLHELKNTDYQPGFTQLTGHFENNWYGNIPVAESDFGNLRQLFSEFNKQLQFE
jgi:hypothetical protein